MGTVGAASPLSSSVIKKMIFREHSIFLTNTDFWYSIFSQMCHKTSKSESTVLKFIELCFYRAMPRRARLCHRMSSVCPSVCLSVHPPVCDDQVCFFHTGWNNSKIISRLISLRFLLGLTSTWAIWCNGNTHKHRGCVMSTKTALSPKRCKIGPRLL